MRDDSSVRVHVLACNHARTRISRPCRPYDSAQMCIDGRIVLSADKDLNWGNRIVYRYISSPNATTMAIWRKSKYIADQLSLQAKLARRQCGLSHWLCGRMGNQPAATTSLPTVQALPHIWVYL